MALAAPPGAENPSPALLDGQAHGAALAVQHHVAAKVGKVAAPTIRTPATATAPGPLTLNDLLGEAQSTAQAETTAEVNAIKAQQNLYNQQAGGGAAPQQLSARPRGRCCRQGRNQSAPCRGR